MITPSNDDEIRAVIIRDVISLVVLHKSGPEEGKNRDQLPEDAPTWKRKQVNEPTTGGCDSEIVKHTDKERSCLNSFPSEGSSLVFDEHRAPSELVRTEHTVSQLGAFEAKDEQEEIEDRSGCDPSPNASTKRHTPTVFVSFLFRVTAPRSYKAVYRGW